MMDLITAVSSVGFPIVAFIMIFYMMQTTLKSNTKAIRELTNYIRGKR